MNGQTRKGGRARRAAKAACTALAAACVALALHEVAGNALLVYPGNDGDVDMDLGLESEEVVCRREAPKFEEARTYSCTYNCRECGTPPDTYRCCSTCSCPQTRIVHDCPVIAVPHNQIRDPWEPDPCGCPC